MFKKGSIYPAPRAGAPVSAPHVAAMAVTDAVKAATAQEKPATVPAAQPASEMAPSVARLVVGPGVKLKGAEIRECDTLLVEGRVEATMDSRFFQIADQGSFDGKVNVDVAEIHGHFSGELTARQQLVIHATGRVNGKIRYGKIVIHEGGELSGDVKSANAAEARDDAGASQAKSSANESRVAGVRVVSA